MIRGTAFPLEGGCDCRHVRFRLETAPLIVHCCHCRWCQRESGASFALNAVIESSRVSVLAAEPEFVQTPSRRAAGASRSLVARGAASPYGATTRVPVASSASCGWARWMSLTIFRRTFTSSPRPSSPGWSCRLARLRCPSTTSSKSTGPSTVWIAERLCCRRSRHTRRLSAIHPPEPGFAKRRPACGSPLPGTGPGSSVLARLRYRPPARGGPERPRMASGRDRDRARSGRGAPRPQGICALRRH